MSITTPNQVAEANAGERLRRRPKAMAGQVRRRSEAMAGEVGFAGKSRIVLRHRPGVAELVMCLVAHNKTACLTRAAQQVRSHDAVFTT